jgi:ATPase family protein associated with various cellular activities (AAA)
MIERTACEIRRVIAGQDALLERTFVAVLAGGHLLIEGVPGLAKTLSIKTVASVLGGTFQRVQFTPDLVPSDIVGRASSGPTAPTSTPAGAGRPVVSGTGKLTAFSQVRFSCFPGAPSILESHQPSHAYQRGRRDMTRIIRKTAATFAALAALGLGGAAIGAAATGSSSSTAASTITTSTTAKAGKGQPLAADVAAKVKAAALAKVPGATVLRTESGGPNGAAYHAHIKLADGTLQVVLVNSSFVATAVQADNAGGGRGHGGRGGGSGETALSGDTKAKVEAAVLAKYPGATIVRTETNNDSTAPYESHITTSAGQELEVLVSSTFAVVDARTQGGHH